VLPRCFPIAVEPITLPPPTYKVLILLRKLVELRGFEPLTSAVRLQRSPI
jgi:hypothetical protein